MGTDIKRTTKAINKETLKAYMVRVKLSRPNVSVPKG
jgi:hypothetical protein